MDSMRTTLRRGRNVWDQVNMPASEFEGRVDNIRKKMGKEGIDALLVCGDAWLEYGTSCYVTNLYAGMGISIALIPQKGDVALLFWGSSRGIQYTEANTWINNLKPGPDVATSCIKYLEELGLLPSTIGFAGLRQLMPYSQFQPFLKSLSSCKIVDADHIISDLRMVKSTRERDQVHRAARILNHMFETTDRTPPKNMDALTLDAALDKDARMEGAEDVRLLYANPKEDNWTLKPVQDIELSPGNTVIIYLAVEFDRYWAEIIRTYVVEKAGLKEIKSEVLDKLYEQVMNKIKPGKKISQFYKEAAAEVKKNAGCYIPEYGLGQGIGLSVDEPPALTEEDTNVLQTGMCLGMRLAVKDKDKGAIMTGNTIHLAEDGPELLTG